SDVCSADLTYTHTHTHTHTHTQTHTQTQTQTNTHTHKQPHTYTHTYTITHRKAWSYTQERRIELKAERGIALQADHLPSCELVPINILKEPITGYSGPCFEKPGLD